MAFSVDDDAMDAYMNAVKYVEETYYLKVSRFTNSGFLRLKLLAKMKPWRRYSHRFLDQHR